MTHSETHYVMSDGTGWINTEEYMRLPAVALKCERCLFFFFFEDSGQTEQKKLQNPCKSDSDQCLTYR